MQKHNVIIDIIKLSPCVDRFTHLLVKATKDHIITGILINDKRGPTQNVMLVDGNLLAGVWAYL